MKKSISSSLNYSLLVLRLGERTLMTELLALPLLGIRSIKGECFWGLVVAIGANML